jgi:hypothetical protein
VTAVAPGAATLTATSEGRTATVALAVVRVPVAAVAFPAGVAAGVTLREGETQGAAATVTDARYQVRTDRPVAYTTADPAVATVDANGTVTARGAGQTTLTATAEGQAAAVAVTVRAVRAALFPASIVAAPNATGRLWATLRDDDGARVRATAVAYESSDPSVVAVDAATGAYKAVGAGTATLRATVNGKVAASAVAVRGAGATLFPIEIAFVGDVPQVARDAARAAADRWQRVIAQAATTERIDLGASGCYAGSAPVAATVRGLLLLVVADSLNPPSAHGGTVALAAACVSRGGAGYEAYRYGGLPVVGVIQFDTTMQKRQVANFGADAPRMIQDVFAHEIGHVFGVGNAWNFAAPENPRRFVPDAAGADPRYVAPAGVAAAQALGFPDATVAVENAGGPASRGTHWRQAVYGRELMTAFVQAGGMALSALTVRSLADFGFAVDETAADLTTAADLNAQAFGPRDPMAALPGALSGAFAAPFTAAGPAAGRAAALGAGARGIALGDDDVTAPRWVVGRDGAPRRLAPQ